MATTQSKDGTTIAYDSTGDGPALLLVAGAFQDRRAMAAYAEPLAKDFTVYTYDRRGRGDSGDTQPYAIEREIEDIAAMIEVAGGDAFVFGGSSGAVLTLDAAAHGVPMTKLALYEPPFVVDDSRPPVPDDLVARLRETVEDGRPGDAAELYLAQGVRMPAEQIASMRRAPSWKPGVEPAAPTLVYDAMIMDGTMTGRPLPAHRWATVDVPTIVIDGSESFPWLEAGTDAIATLLHAERVTLAGAEHGVAPDTLAPALVKFFS
jgi:pimeloyl-ACP methyl ester carboxylesterase